MKWVGPRARKTAEISAREKKIFILSDENQCLLCLLGVNISYQNEISNNSGLAKGLGSLKEM